MKSLIGFCDPITQEYIEDKIDENPNISCVEYYKKFNDMLMRHQFAAATAYVKALSNRYSKFQKTYEFMAYAINDPMMKCSYNSNAILNLPDVEGFNDDYLFMSVV